MATHTALFSGLTNTVVVTCSTISLQVQCSWVICANQLHSYVLCIDISLALYVTELLLELSHRSENHTQDLFLRVYEKLAPQARAPIITLYSEIRRALTDSSATASLNDSSSELEEAVNTFFSQLFPLVYRHSVTHAPGELSEDYAVCLQATMPEVRPYGETPRALATSVSRSIRATRVLLRALKLGIETLDTTERVWERGEECSVALLRMSYCARCAGLPTVKPCAGYCLNVLRGCLAHLAELDASWNGFVDGVERLVLAARAPTALLNVETVIRTMDTRVSEAIMHAMENGPALEKRVSTLFVFLLIYRQSTQNDLHNIRSKQIYLRENVLFLDLPARLQLLYFFSCRFQKLLACFVTLYILYIDFSKRIIVQYIFYR
ncbi:hypothetical protein B566_EDAN017657 [Ephemera danica]|nr:hypothetical protein B566_EDAN017657 [Ephemera danica]